MKGKEVVNHGPVFTVASGLSVEADVYQESKSGSFWLVREAFVKKIIVKAEAKHLGYWWISGLVSELHGKMSRSIVKYKKGSERILSVVTMRS